jgi:hypothetical protein
MYIFPLSIVRLRIVRPESVVFAAAAGLVPTSDVGYVGRTIGAGVDVVGPGLAARAGAALTAARHPIAVAVTAKAARAGRAVLGW